MCLNQQFYVRQITQQNHPTKPANRASSGLPPSPLHSPSVSPPDPPPSPPSQPFRQPTRPSPVPPLTVLPSPRPSPHTPFTALPSPPSRPFLPSPLTSRRTDTSDAYPRPTRLELGSTGRPVIP